MRMHLRHTVYSDQSCVRHCEGGTLKVTELENKTPDLRFI